jgi:hypothetical protein
LSSTSAWLAAARTFPDVLAEPLSEGSMSRHYAVARLQEERAALELITNERYAFNKSLASIARDAVGTSVPTQTKSG